MVRNYIPKDPKDYLKRGPKPKQISDEVKLEIRNKINMGVPIAKVCRDYELSFYIVKRILDFEY